MSGWKREEEEMSRPKSSIIVKSNNPYVRTAFASAMRSMRQMLGNDVVFEGFIMKNHDGYLFTIDGFSKLESEDDVLRITNKAMRACLDYQDRKRDKLLEKIIEPENDEELSAIDAAQYLGMSYTDLCNNRYSRDPIPSHKNRSRVFYWRSDLDAYRNFA